MSVQGKYWCFTDFECRTDYSDWGAKYLIYGVEECPTTKKMHHQGYCEFETNQRQSTLGKRWKCNFERRKGTSEQAIVYCMKDGKWTEFGERPAAKEQGKRSDIDEVREMVKGGKSMREIADVCSSFQALRFAENLTQYYEKKRDWVTEVFWYHGPTGSGKTRTAYEEAGPNCWISGKNLKWFQGYDGHENVIFDDFRKDFCTFHELLRLLDRYPYTIEVKGGSRQFLAKKIWITCPFKPEDLYDTREDVEQLLRRITVVKAFPVVPEFSWMKTLE